MIKDKSYNSHKYAEVFLIIQWKDGCVYRTKRLGHISLNDSGKYPSDKYVLTSVSTRHIEGEDMELEEVTNAN